MLLTQRLDGGFGEESCSKSIMSEDIRHGQNLPTPACTRVNICKHNGHPYYRKHHIAMYHTFTWLYHLASDSDVWALLFGMSAVWSGDTLSI